MKAGAFCCLLALATAQPLSSSEKEAVGNALSEALSVMSGKTQSGSKISICMNMFPDGPPANAAKDVTWKSCKDVLPSYSNRRARSMLLSSNRTPLTAAEKESVGKALTEALRTVSGKGTPKTMYESCSSLFPTGKATAEDKKSPMWTACKDELLSSLMQRAVRLVRGASPLTSEEKAIVGSALEGALKAVQGKGGGGDLWEMCDDQFPDGKRPADMAESDPTWVACKDKVWNPADHPTSLLSVRKHA